MEKLIALIAKLTDINYEDALNVAREARDNGELFVQALVSSYPKHAATILLEYSKLFRIQIAKLDGMDIPPNIISLVDRKIAQAFQMIPIDRAGNNIIIAMTDPHDLKKLDEIRFKTGFSPKPVFATKASIKAALQQYYKMADVEISQITSSKGKSVKRQMEREIIQDAGDDPVVKLVNQVLLQCVLRGASDIHIEPFEHYLRIRLRIDGALVEIARPPANTRAQIISRIKIMANMDIAEKRLPQDGGIRTEIDRKPIDFRVNSMPTVHGEKIVLRILDKSSLEVDMTKLGFEPKDFKNFREAIHKPFGMVLVTGPTGSGKTTTLYSALQELNKVTSNITTAEDPVEFNLDGINQVQVIERINLTFASALRAFLRQDPDIIMVGEIRDQTTGEIAIKAALTGHLVLSTLHTNNASDTITRLIDMGLEPFNIISSLNAVVAQRLVRRVCNSCSVPADLSKISDSLNQLGISEALMAKANIRQAKGCEVCSGSGYKGRIAIHELLVMSDPIRQIIMKGGSGMDIKRQAMREGMMTLRQNATIKLLKGLTDIKEVYANTASDSKETNEAA